MGANIGSSKGSIASINITPLVDVVLVLLIIFMLLIKEEASFVPNTVPQSADDTEEDAPTEILVLEILDDKSVLLNRQPTNKAEFPEYFEKLMQERIDKKLFVSVDDEVLYEEVVYWMSLAKAKGASLVALQIRKPKDYSDEATE